jgi:hypothetical protein
MTMLAVMVMIVVMVVMMGIVAAMAAMAVVAVLHPVGVSMRMSMAVIIMPMMVVVVMPSKDDLHCPKRKHNLGKQVTQCHTTLPVLHVSGTPFFGILSHTVQVWICAPIKQVAPTHQRQQVDTNANHCRHNMAADATRKADAMHPVSRHCKQSWYMARLSCDGWVGGLIAHVHGTYSLAVMNMILPSTYSGGLHMQ